MSVRDTIGVYDTAEFADNPEARCPIVLILDISASMKGHRIKTVNQALTKFRDIIREDSVTALRADVAIVAFAGKAWVTLDFTNGADFEPPVLSADSGYTRDSGTNYSNAINLALDITEARKQSYRDGGVAYYRSLAYFLTDGEPLDKGRDLNRAAARLSEVEENRGIAFFAFQVGGKVTKELANLAPSNRPPVELKNMEQLDGSIQWLSRSVAAVSQSQPGESIRLPKQDFLDF